MIPFEFTIKGPPVSLQTRRRARLQRWKSEVAAKAKSAVRQGATPTVEPVTVTITYYYEGSSPDVDNIIKPIQDALNGIVYCDDKQVVDTRARKRPINGSFKIRGVSGVLLGAFAEGDEFLYVEVGEAPNMEVLD